MQKNIDEIDNDIHEIDNDIHEIILKQVKIIKDCKLELDTELGKNSYPEEILSRCVYEVNKDLRTDKIQKDRYHQETKNYDGDTGQITTKPSEKQLNYAKKLGIEKPEQYDKYVLSEKIGEKKKELGYE